MFNKKLIIFLFLLLLLASCKNDDKNINDKNLLENIITNDENINDINNTIDIYKVVADVLNVREKPDVNSKIVARLIKGDEVLILDYNYDDDFAVSIYDGNLCYVNKKYIDKEKFSNKYIDNINEYKNLYNDIKNKKDETYKENIEIVNTDKKIKKSYPIVDGSTANIPLMAQIRSDYLNEDLIYSQNKIEVSTTDAAWINLVDENCDLLIVYEGSDETKEYIKNSDKKLRITPIGVDALVFLENENNKVNNLSTEQIQKIYTGEITNWLEVGGDNIEIQSFQRPINSGSQTLFLNLVMKNLKPKDAIGYFRPAEMDGLIETIASYENLSNAIGYSVYYYAKKMYQVPGVKLISVDNIIPNDNTISNGEYPFINTFYVVAKEDDLNTDSEIKKLYDYIISDKGREALIKSGYIPVKN